MKTKTWTVDPQTGAVSLVGPFSHGLSPLEVKAATKGEATAKILARAARQAAAGGPRLFVRNGAFCLAIHNGETWSTQAGTTHPRNAYQTGDREQFASCHGGTYADIRDAIKASGMDHYASGEFQAHERANYGANGTTEAELIATLRELTAAVGKVNASQARELGLVMPHAIALATLGKFTGSRVPAGQVIAA
jgi:hypothetical protein